MSRRGVLAGLSFLTIWWAGIMHAAFYNGHLGHPETLWSVKSFLAGLSYALPLSLFLAAHEGAHVYACHRYRIRSTGPYVLPVGLPMVGTFGAFMKVHDPYPSRTALFDVAVSGPLAGGVIALASLLIGSLWTVTDPYPIGLSFARFGTPEIVDYLRGPGGVLHPLALAGWIGLIITGLNLLPYGHFDGGEIVSSLVGPQWALAVSLLTLIGVASMSLHSMTACIVLIVMGLTGWSSSGTVSRQPLPASRYAVAALAVLLLGISLI